MSWKSVYCDQLALG